jgi:hypothetical protein
MRKITVFILLLGIIGFPLYAQLGPGLGIGGWARYVFSPIGATGMWGEEFNEDNFRVSTQSFAPSFFPQKGKIGLAAWGNSDFVGFNFDFAYQNARLEVGDQAKIWIRPHDMLMLHAGKIQGNMLRGTIPGGQLVNMEEEDDVFFRFYPQYGILIDFRPINNFYLGVSVDAGNASFRNAFGENSVYGWESERTDSGYQIGAGYQFNFGHLRAQFISFQNGKPLQVAMSYTDIYNLNIELSGKYPLRPLPNSPASATIAAEYTFERLYAMGRYTHIFYPEGTGDWFKIGSVIKYTINFPLFLGLELSFISDNPLTQAVDELFQISPYLGFRYGRGELRIGLFWQQRLDADNPSYVFEVPILFEARFF